MKTKASRCAPGFDVSSNYSNHYLVNVRNDNFPLHSIFVLPTFRLAVCSFTNDIRMNVSEEP